MILPYVWGCTRAFLDYNVCLLLWVMGHWLGEWHVTLALEILGPAIVWLLWKIPMQSFLFSLAVIIANICSIDFVHRHIKPFVPFMYLCLLLYNALLKHKTLCACIMVGSCNENFTFNSLLSGFLKVSIMRIFQLAELFLFNLIQCHCNNHKLFMAHSSLFSCL